MKKNVTLVILLIMLLAAGCMPGHNPSEDMAGADGHMAGFLMGLWHGCISPVTFVISLFSDKINFYEVHNNGGWYNFGFVLGAGIIFGGGSRASRKNS